MNQLPYVIYDNDELIEELSEALLKKHEEGIDVCIRISEDVDLPAGLQPYIKTFEYVTSPVTCAGKACPSEG